LFVVFWVSWVRPPPPPPPTHTHTVPVQPVEIERSSILLLESVVLGTGQFGIVTKGVYAPGGTAIRISTDMNNRVNIALGTKKSDSTTPILRVSSLSTAATWRMPRQAPYNVAVKSLKKQSTDEDRAALLEEASLTAQFDHVNVIHLVGVVTAGSPMLLVRDTSTPHLHAQAHASCT
jgi:hypothetical protein